MQTRNTYVTGVWYSTYDSPYILPSSSTAITNMTIPINIQTGDAVYILYTGELDLPDATYTVFEVYIDGAYSSSGHGSYASLAGSGEMFIPVSVQHYITSLSAGPHSISLHTYKSSGGSAQVLYSKLFIQSYHV